MYFSMFLMEDGTVRGAGNNGSYQCGMGNRINPQIEIQTIPNLYNVKAISCGQSYTMFLMEDGTVKSVGANDHGQCGMGISGYYINNIESILGLNNIKDISCGISHTIFTMMDGTVKVVGNNGSGQLGLGNRISPQLTITTIPNLIGVRSTSCGDNFTIFLMEDGTLKSVGENNQGQLGLGTKTSYELTIKDVPDIVGVKSVSCGRWITVVLMKDGTVKSFGYGSSYIPKNTTNVRGVSCGDDYVMVLKRDGTVLSAGSNSNGQTGLNSPETTIPSLRKIPNLIGVKSISCGNSHTIFLMKDGTARSVGNNSYGQCIASVINPGNTSNQIEILELPIEKVKSLWNKSPIKLSIIITNFVKLSNINMVEKLSYSIIDVLNKPLKHRITLRDGEYNKIRVLKEWTDTSPLPKKIKINY